jgi:hypothetical protein
MLSAVKVLDLNLGTHAALRCTTPIFFAALAGLFSGVEELCVHPKVDAGLGGGLLQNEGYNVSSACILAKC